MLIDNYDTRWLDRFDVSKGVIYLLLDGVFVPGLHRRSKAMVPASHAPSLLFEKLPGCSDKTRDVSPFLVQFQPTNSRFLALLKHCSGWPMTCAIETTESQSALTERLAAWCVVEVDGQRFNFRFPDTRRLPAIFDVLSDEQRAELAGPATKWSYIDRGGHWQELAVPRVLCEIADRPRLSDAQFATLVNDSEADEVISILAYQGHEVGSHSRSHATVTLALHVARNADLGIHSKAAWCGFCLAGRLSPDKDQLAALLPQWIGSLSLERDALLVREA
ncbi:MAG: hypothetical protein JWR65_3400 [Massilia sp.]|nr:hypothetical protein [Massilia sp.]